MVNKRSQKPNKLASERETRRRAEHLLSDVVKFAEAATVEDDGVLGRLIGEVDGSLVLGDAMTAFHKWKASDIQALQTELRDFLRAIVTLKQSEHGAIVPPPVRFTKLEISPTMVDDDAFLLVDGAARDALWFQIIAMIRFVGIGRLQQCATPGCSGVALRLGKRTHCSVACYQRWYMAQSRAREREQRRREEAEARKRGRALATRRSR